MRQFSTNLASELHVAFDRDSVVPMHEQLEVGLRDAIRSGRLPGGAAVPATRRLAEQLGLSRGVVVEAYQQLTAEGYLVATAGGYTRVAPDIAAALPASAEPPTPMPAPAPSRTPLIDLRYGQPDVSQFPRAAWLRTLRTVLTQTPNERLAYGDGRGVPELRAALSDYLDRVRGTWSEPEDIVVCNGFAQAISLVLPVLRDHGVARLAVEDPADPDARRAAELAGLEVVGIPVDASGLDIAALEASGARAVLVTPAHQHPTGCVLSPERRAALVAWARSVDGFVIEDDYDAEYRYDQSPVGSVQGLAPDQVIYAGTASKTLAPGLRIGWIIAPRALADDLARRKRELDRGSPVIDQLAFAEFLLRGEFDRHLRRMRPVYRVRRDAMIAAMARHLPELVPIGIAAGLHVFSWLPDDLDERAVVAAASAEGVVLEGCARYHVRGTGRGGLIFGYAKLDHEAIEAGAVAVRRAIDQVRREPTRV